MLRIALAEVRAGAVQTDGAIAPGDPVLAGLGASVIAPLEVQGRFSGAGEGKYYWRARAATTVREECRRCLEPVDVPVALDLSVVFTTGSDAPEGDGVYPVALRAQMLELGPVLREELLLGLPQFVECRPDCRGLCPRCGRNLNEGPCGCPPAADSRWDALRALTQPEKD